ncbi:MAG: uroporphyrinogen decarboxylase family protein [Bacillota bacterium]
MNHRERFFNLLQNKEIDRVPFFPDITTWYECTRKDAGAEEIFGPGVYIPDHIDFHQRKSRLAGKMGRMTFLDFYREFDWGLPVHMYQWFEETYDETVQQSVTREGNAKITTVTTPKGTVQSKSLLAADGSWAPKEFFIKEINDIEIIKYLYEHRKITPRFEVVEEFLQETEGFGVCDLVLWRSPFGKLLHDLMGFENLVYALYDHERTISEFLEFLDYHFMKIIELATKAPAKLAIISDHADENLISPKFYKDYCIPYYQKVTAVLHDKGKFVSTHLDGNFKGFFPIIHEAGFDLLDGCTPAPMFNYEVEELATISGDSLHCYCGVPATMFTQRLPTEEIVDFGIRIAGAFRNRVIVNIGDILPPEGDIQQVIELGKAIAAI